MKIGNPLELFRTGAPAGRAGAPDAGKAKAPATPAPQGKGGGSATVRLSGGLATLKTDAQSDGAFDTKRVEQLQAAIANGTFSVDAEVVANKMISGNLAALTHSKS